MTSCSFNKQILSDVASVPVCACVCVCVCLFIHVRKRSRLKLLAEGGEKVHVDDSVLQGIR